MSHPATNLTDRERQILKLIASDLTGHEAAGRLGIAYNTFQHHYTNLRRKLRCGTAGLTHFAIRHGVVKLMLLLISSFSLQPSAFSAASDTNAPTLYAFRNVTWVDPNIPKATGWVVQVHSEITNPPVQVFSCATNVTAVSNLIEGASYYLTALAQRDGLTSYFSSNRKHFMALPGPLTNTVIVIGRAAGSLAGPWLRAFTNIYVDPPAPMQFWRLEIFQTNNLSAYIFYQ